MHDRKAMATRTRTEFRPSPWFIAFIGVAVLASAGCGTRVKSAEAAGARPTVAIDSTSPAARTSEGSANVSQPAGAGNVSGAADSTPSTVSLPPKPSTSGRPVADAAVATGPVEGGRA
jgi:hypothetical protein